LVSRDDAFAELEIDRTVIEMEAFGSSILRLIVIERDVKVPVRQVVAFIVESSG